MSDVPFHIGAGSLSLYENVCFSLSRRSQVCGHLSFTCTPFHTICDPWQVKGVAGDTHYLPATCHEKGIEGISVCTPDSIATMRRLTARKPPWQIQTLFCQCGKNQKFGYSLTTCVSVTGQKLQSLFDLIIYKYQNCVLICEL